MKASEFRKLIREEVRKVMNEEVEDFEQNMKKLASELTKLNFTFKKDTNYPNMAGNDEPYSFAVKLPKGTIQVGIGERYGTEFGKHGVPVDVFYLDSNSSKLEPYVGEYNSIGKLINVIKKASL